MLVGATRGEVPAQLHEKLQLASIGALFLLFLGAHGRTFSTEPFDSREATIDNVHNALYFGLASCRDVVSSFITRIEAFNPTVNAIMSLNPNAFELNTTGGCLDLAGNKPSVDAPAVIALKNAGAIILGKTNLHELALEGLSVSSLGGQTINPYDKTRTSGGSSGGTGAAIATSLAVFGTGEDFKPPPKDDCSPSSGTDTMNSLRSPASVNSLFSVRPTRGLISRAGIIPISYTQDAIGPIVRNVKDLAVALNVMASIGYDPNDNTTSLFPSSSTSVDYSAAISGGGLKGLRFGLLEGFFNCTSSNETTPVNNAISYMVATFEAAGAEVVSTNETLYNATAIASLDVQTSEYR
ncbi:hypothetical protein G7Y89_g2128 [Cudoniella acicularis]|uniref:Amidase domain-containing protein n=1 Tax=Cudoniella acicularis TaxID=354080 RepID=A0A8H4RV25_9HELO|nr:hypothetical protein G7Y89_g2128 [Cudoniella acicularis]